MTNLTQIPMYTSLTDLVDLAINHDSTYVDCSFQVTTPAGIFHAYHASIVHRDILLYTDKGTVTYLVDSYGDKHTCELYDWGLDSDND